jgi:UDP-N-acetyl-alpha-D-muramoyl-L-alanyl-L-glutamate epimerase
MSDTNQTKFKKLRKKFPVFVYEEFSWRIQNNTLHLLYHFSLANKHNFFPRLAIPLKEWSVRSLDNRLINNIAFNIGMVELVSYWKTACPAKVIIRPFRLTPEQQDWWRKLYFQGLGEFFHLNKIDINESEMLTFNFDEDSRFLSGNFELTKNDGVIIPIGGGKDSLVSLSVLNQANINKVAFAINPGRATLESVKIAGLENNFFEVGRTIDPLLLQLNNEGFLNGHTPFSALVAFVSLLASAITGNSYIALSNEASANEPTIPGTDINHQYSKSIDFEKDFRKYVIRNITPDIQYFSILRPLNEIQIGAIFSQNPDYYKVFRSCNVGSKTNSWCCNCPKCLFTYIMLSSFIDTSKMVEIFGENLLDKKSLIPLLEQLAGLTAEKPFECIGTIEEVNSALASLSASYPEDTMPILLRHHKQKTPHIRFSGIHEQLRHWNATHYLNPFFEKLLQNSIAKTQA